MKEVKTMNKIGLMITTLIIMNISIYAENTVNSEPDTSMETLNSHVHIRNVRSILGSYNPIKHTKGQIRAGYINFSEDETPDSKGYALGGHFHFYSKRWNGLMIGAEAYGVLDVGMNQNSDTTNGYFFDADGDSFIVLSQIYLDGTWGNSTLKLGRQLLDTPHADSDDIRMMPNYFEAYTFTNTDVKDLTLSAGLIRKMAGWENGIDSKEFVNISETLGVNDNIDGLYYAAASYEGVKNFSLSLWYYHYNHVANVLYAEAGYAYTLSDNVIMTLGLQYDSSQETGSALLGKQDAQTYGISMETTFEDIGLTLLAAYNEDNGDTGAMGLSLGGGAFFTSMEDQTLDTLGTSGKAWVIGAGYAFEKVGLEGLAFTIAYGNFEADDASIYHTNEIDAIFEYEWNDKVSATAAYTSVEHKTVPSQDYSQLRIIVNYNF